MRLGRAATPILACLLLALSAAATARGEGACRFADGVGAAGTISDEGQTWLYRFDPMRIRIGEPFAVEIFACDVGMELQSVDAVMPVHRHGMNYIPRLERTRPGQWRAERMLFHMPGLWRLHIIWRGPAGRADGRADVTVP